MAWPVGILTVVGCVALTVSIGLAFARSQPRQLAA